MCVYIWRSEGNFQGLILSLYYMGPRVRTQVIRLGGKYSNPLSHPNSLCFVFLRQDLR